MGLNKLFLPILLLISLAASAQVRWMTLDKAMEAQKEVPKKILIDVYTVWCGPCKLLDKNTFGNPDVSAYINENYYAVKFNAEGDETINYQNNTFTNPNYDSSRSGRNARHQFTAYLGVTGYPTVVFLDEKGQFITPVVGYHDVQQMEFYLKLFHSDDYKALKSQTDFTAYFKNFKPLFKS